MLYLLSNIQKTSIQQCYELECFLCVVRWCQRTRRDRCSMQWEYWERSVSCYDTTYSCISRLQHDHFLICRLSSQEPVMGHSANSQSNLWQNGTPPPPNSRPQASYKIYCLQCGIYTPHSSICLLEAPSVDISFHKGQMLASIVPRSLPHPSLLAVWITHTASNDGCCGGLGTRVGKCCVWTGNEATILPLASFPSSRRAWDKSYPSPNLTLCCDFPVVLDIVASRDCSAQWFLHCRRCWVDYTR